MIGRLAGAAFLLAAAVAVAAPPQSGADTTPLYQSAGKRMAPVTLMTDGVYRARVGATLTVPLAFRAQADAEDVRIEIVADEGVLLDNAQRRRSLGPVRAGEFALPELSVTPLRDGRHYITVNVFMANGSWTRFRSFAIPVQVGTPTAHKSAPTVSGADGRRLHILPARELP